MHSGRVQQLLRNHGDEVDGLRLEDGFEVRFPPHIGHQVVEFIQPGDDITLKGQNVTRPRGEIVFDVTQIEFEGQTITVDHPPHPHCSEAKEKTEPTMTVCGTVSRFVTNPHGDVDGLVLSDQTEVKFPPHQGQALQEFVRIGDEVRAEGRRHVTRRGDIHLHADRIVAVATGRTLDRFDDVDHGTDLVSTCYKRHEESAEPTNTDLMRELLGLRSLIEQLRLNPAFVSADRD